LDVTRPVSDSVDGVVFTLFYHSPMLIRISICPDIIEEVRPFPIYICPESIEEGRPFPIYLIENKLFFKVKRI